MLPAHKLRSALLLLLFSGLFYAAASIKIPVVDTLSDRYFSESIQASTVAYATVRAVNAVVSVVKESELEVAPAGVGITIAAGQILDPVDDMTERLSSVLVAAIASLGIQKLGYELGAAISFQTIAVLLLLMIPLLWSNAASVRLLHESAIKLCLLLLLLRFMLPLSALISDTLYQQTLQPMIGSAIDQLSAVSGNYQDMSHLPEQQQGFFSSMTSGATDKIDQIKAAFEQMVSHAEQITGALLSLMTAYLAVFVVQVLMLPLLMLWLLLRLSGSRALNAMAGELRSSLTASKENHDHTAL